MLIEHAASPRRDVSGRLHPWMQAHRTSGRFKYSTFGRCCQGENEKDRGCGEYPERQRAIAQNVKFCVVAEGAKRPEQLRKTHVLRSCEATTRAARKRAVSPARGRPVARRQTRERGKGSAGAQPPRGAFLILIL